MNRAPVPTHNHAWIGLAIALAAAVASLHWYRKPPPTSKSATPSHPSAVAMGDARAAQRSMMSEIRALVAAERMNEARVQAAVYYEKWPDGPDAAELERMTGVRRR